MNNKVVLAFSGGLDTSFCVRYLTSDLGLEVHTITVDTGGFSHVELENIEEHAYGLGVKSHIAKRVTEGYYNHFLKYLIFGNVLKNNAYPLSVSAERVMQAVTVANYAVSLGINKIAHGSTGAGNDQVRFDMIFETLLPQAEIITPIRDLKLSRQAEIDYLLAQGIEMDAKKAQYSINKGLWGTSVGGVETLTSSQYLPEEAWPTQITKSTPEEITISFVAGEPRKLNGKEYPNSVALIQELEAIAAPFGIGRDIHVGDTIIGIKGRVGFEAAAPIIIIKAHHLLEKHILGKWQLFWKDQLATWYGNWLHEGQYLDPAMRDIEALLQSSQRRVEGEVRISLFPHRFQLNGIQSPNDLLQSKAGTYGEMNNGWSGDDVKGFAKIFGNQTQIYHQMSASSELPFL